MDFLVQCLSDALLPKSEKYQKTLKTLPRVAGASRPCGRKK